MMRRSTLFPQFSGPPETPLSYAPVGKAQLADRTDGCVRLQCGSTTVEVSALAPDLFRVGMFGHGRPVEYRSQAVLDREWAVQASVETTASEVRLATASATAVIALDPLRIGFRDATREFALDDPTLGMGFSEIGPVDPFGAPAVVWKAHLPGTRYFGCGERTGGLEKTNSHQVFWNVDPPMGHTASLNNLYTSIPFVLALCGGRAWGLFVDSTYRLEFDLAHGSPERCGFAVDGGPLIYYVFAGPTPADVVERYGALTGRIPLPPKWALGNHQSRWGYKSADEILHLARTFRERNIPLDAVYLDIDYMDGYRVFTWDKKRFPDPAGLVRALDDAGVKLVTIIDPGVKVDQSYGVYRAGRAADLFCKTVADSEYHNVVWPGVCAFPDFTNPRTSEWWGDQLNVLTDAGVAGIWCDMNEPTMFVPTPQTLPDDVVHRGDSEGLLHAQVHNLYGQLMAAATYAGLQKLRPDRRTFVISRSGFAGLQRYAVHWTGDNSSWWEHLWMSMPQLQNLGLSGYAWVGVDIGGFSGDATGELLTRWTEFGIFQPFCRNHSAWNTHPQEPWAFGEPYESHIRSMLQLRQRLIPYLYTLFHQAHRTSAPILRPLLFQYPEDETTYTSDDEFLLGAAMLVAPIARPGVEHRHVYLPRGTWVHYWTGQVHSGPTHILAHAPLGRPAVYVRANTPVPLWPVTSHDPGGTPIGLTWKAFVDSSAEDGAGEVYEDAGEGFGYRDGQFALTRVTCRASAAGVDLTFENVDGRGAGYHTTVDLELRGVPRPTQVSVDGRVIDAWEHADETLRVRLNEGSHAVHVAADLR